ncbi:MAG: glycoside hydrolase [Chitinophagaceae bacterium]|nr:glycoside hydrolase [Chitinophagaceae bacterium]
MMKIFLYSFLAALILSCNTKEKTTGTFATPGLGISKDSAFAGSCPYLFQAADGTTLISWLRDVSDTQAVLCYAIAENGADFGPTITVPGSDNAYPHGENLPRVIKTPDGKTLATWGASNPNPQNPYSGIVYYSWSLDNGKSWTDPQTLSRDTNSIDQRYFDIEILKDNTVGVIWLDNRKNTDREGSSLYFAAFDDNNIPGNEKPIDATCCPCCRTDLFVDKQGNLHTVYRKIINDSIRDIVHAVSADNGKTFSAPERISPDGWVINGCPHTGPAIAQTSGGLSFVWYTQGNGSGVFYAGSKDNGKTFSKKEPVSAVPSAKHPQLAIANTGEQLTVWDEGALHGNRIGLEIRSADGKKRQTGYLTDSTSYASFPVIKAFGKGFIVAYAGKEQADDEEKIFYKIIHPL